MFGSNSHRIPFSEANFFLNEIPFRRLHLEVKKESFGFVNNEKFDNKLNKSCKYCNLKELQFTRIVLLKTFTLCPTLSAMISQISVCNFLMQLVMLIQFPSVHKSVTI